MKRVTISVDEKWWGEVRVEALREGKTVGKFLMSLFKRPKDKAGCVAPGTVAKVPNEVIRMDDFEVKVSDVLPVEKPKAEKIAELKSTGFFNPMPKKVGK
jgi:hypothetical protein